jgi:hypothetical protein
MIINNKLGKDVKGKTVNRVEAFVGNQTQTLEYMTQ